MIVHALATLMAVAEPVAPAASTPPPAAPAASERAPSADAAAPAPTVITAPDPAAPSDAKRAIEDDGKARARRVGVTRLELHDVERKVGLVVEDSLLAELRKLARTSVIGMREIRAMMDLEADKQSVGCKDDASCLSEIADAVGVDTLVTGSLTRTGDESVLSLRRIDQRAASVVATFEQRLTPAGGEEFLAALGSAVAQLFPDVPLRAGAVRGVDPEVALRLNPPPIPPLVTIASIGVTAVLAASTAGALATQLSFMSARDEYAAKTATQVQDGATLNEKAAAANNAATVALALGISTGIAAAATGALAAFTDWTGAGEPLLDE
jgi:hypothetical protein